MVACAAELMFLCRSSLYQGGTYGYLLKGMPSPLGIRIRHHHSQMTTFLDAGSLRNAPEDSRDISMTNYTQENAVMRQSE